MAPPRRFSEIAEYELACRYEAGETSGDLAREKRTTKKVIIEVLRRQGVLVRQQSSRPNYQHKVVTERKCEHCKSVLPIVDFAPMSGTGRRKNRGTAAVEYVCRNCLSLSRTLRIWRLSRNEYAQLLALQNGGCAICGKAYGSTLKGKPRRLSVDHDHITGEIRGLLCSDHNWLLGLAGDREDILLKAIDYLRHPPARSVLGQSSDKDDSRLPA